MNMDFSKSFMDFSEVPGGEDYPDALNLGLLDQIAALQWIKENIASYPPQNEQNEVGEYCNAMLNILAPSHS